MLGSAERKPFVPAVNIFAMGKGVDFDQFEDRTDSEGSKPDAESEYN